jgi:hypothetical protein
VSRAFQDVVADPIAWCERVVLHKAPVSELVSLRRLVPRALERVTHLDTRSRHEHTPLSVLPKHFDQQRPSRIHTLRMHGDGASVLVSRRLALSSRLFPALAHISVETTRFDTVPLLLAHLPSLTALHVFWRTSKRRTAMTDATHLVVRVPAKLVSLRIRDAHAGAMPGEKHAVTFAPESCLRTLHMRDLALVGLPPSITDLAVSDHCGVTERGVYSNNIIDVLGAMRLQRLSLDDFRLTSPATDWVAMLRPHTALVRLRIRGCNIDWRDPKVTAAVAALADLEMLRIDSPHRFAAAYDSPRRFAAAYDSPHRFAAVYDCWWRSPSVAPSAARLRLFEARDDMGIGACVPPDRLQPTGAVVLRALARATPSTTMTPKTTTTATTGAASALADAPHEKGLVVDALVTKMPGLGAAIGCILFPPAFDTRQLHFRVHHRHAGVRHLRVRVKIVHATFVDLLASGCVVRVGETRWRSRYHYSSEDARCRHYDTRDSGAPGCYCRTKAADMPGRTDRIRVFSEILSPLS